MRNSRYWMGQHDWFIDDSASVENSGADSGHPIPEAERRRRMGTNPTWEASTAYGLWYLNTTSSVVLEGRCLNDAVVYVHGSATARQGASTILSGTVTTGTMINTGSNVPYSIASASVPSSWTASGAMDKRLRLTSGASAGAHAWVALDQGGAGHVARMTEFLTPVASFAASPFAVPASTNATFANGDTFIVEELRAITRMAIHLLGPPNSDQTTARVVLDSVSTTIAGAVDCGVYCDGSTISTSGDIHRLTLHGCQLITIADTGFKNISGGYATSVATSISNNAARSIALLDHFTLQGNRYLILVGNNAGVNGECWRVGQVGMFDMTSADSCGIYIATICRITGTFLLYGSGNTAQPFVLTNQGALVSVGAVTAPFTSTQPAAIGAGVAGHITRYSFPAYDPGADAWTTPRLASFANLGAAVSAGGFGNFINDPLTLAKGVG
jgi:hypothetical protein